MAFAPDRLKLAVFLQQSSDALTEIVTRLDRLAPSPESMRRGLNNPSEEQLSLLRAWRELQSTGRIESIVDQIPNAVEINGTNIDQLLENHGLYGEQLDFKLQVFNRHLLRFYEVIADLDNQGTPRISRLRGIFNRIRRVSASRSDTGLGV